MAKLDIAELAVEIRERKFSWVARENSVALLSDAVKKRMLGVVVDPGILAGEMAPRTADASAPAFDTAVDWRNRNGNHVTPPKDQGQCGSCVSFCCAGLVESMASIEKGQLLDLSEADLHFCSGHGESCGGWWPSDALEQIKVRGIPDEAAFPYSSAFTGAGGAPVCKIVPDRNQRVATITSWGALSSAADRKNHLSTKGPVSAVLEVYDDFFYYSSGVYKHSSGELAGLHCVLIVGYSETEKCWIAKNSWGTGWGDGGYFKIGYGEAGIDTTYPFHWASGVKLPAGTAFSGWEDLAGILTSRPQAASWGTNRIDVVARGTDCAVWHRAWDGSSWRAWESLGGVIHDAPAISSWGNGRLDIFGTGTDHQLHHRWFQGGWSNWESLGGLLTSEPAAVSWGPNRIDVFARGTDFALWHLWWDGTAWRGWESLGGYLTSAPTVASWGPNRLDVFAAGGDSAMWHLWWDGTAWRGWESLGGVITEAPGAVSWGPNRVDVFARGTNSHMFHKAWNGTRWLDWADLGGILSSGAGASSWSANRLDAFVMGTDSHLYHKWTI
ncbi:MAG: C1 family peptidase [Micropruina sp.]|uniref:C1 family peptidase n=1 Tax=Micropruina sp. TaxID=2737536 RepID=UPI0039E4007B